MEKKKDPEHEGLVTTKGMFRIALWVRGAIPDPVALRTAYLTYEMALEQAERFRGTEEAYFGYSILLVIEDVR